MKTFRTVLLLALLTAGACAGEAEAPVDAELQEAPGSGTEVLPVGLAPVGGSGVTGQATLVGQGTVTRINVSIVGLQPEAQLSGRIYGVSCAEAASGADPLTEIGPVALDPYGTLSTTIGISLEELQQQIHSMVLVDAATSQPVACAEVVAAGA